MGEGAPEPSPAPLGGGEGQEQENEQGGVLHVGLGGILGQKKGKICYRGSEAGGDEWVLVFGDQWRCDGVLLVWEIDVSTMMGVATVASSPLEQRTQTGVGCGGGGGWGAKPATESRDAFVHCSRREIS